MERKQITFDDESALQQFLTCSLCENYFKNKVYITEFYTNICESCALSQYGNHDLFENTNLIKTLNNTQVSCKFFNKATACEKILPYKDLAEHQKVCPHRTSDCPLKGTLGCGWSGKIGEHEKHFSTAHYDNVVEHCYKIRKVLHSDFEIIKQIRDFKSVYLLRFFYVENHNTLLFNIYNYNDQETGSTPCTLELQCNKTNNIYKIKHEIPAGRTLEQILDNEFCVSINLDDLRTIINMDEFLDLTFWIGEEQLLNVFNANLLQTFECPVCNNYMRPPIYQCMVGHSVCATCRPRMEKCPTCRSIIGSIRNFGLENLTANIPYPCSNHDFGCKTVLLLENIKNHESQCLFMEKQCYFKDCSNTGNRAQMKEHFMISHGEHFIADNYIEITMDISLTINYGVFASMLRKEFILHAYESIFRLSFERTIDSSFWVVEVDHIYEEHKEFTYEIGIKNPSKPLRKLSKVEVCLPDVPKDAQFKKGIMFPNNVLNSYTHSNMFIFYCKITCIN